MTWHWYRWQATIVGQESGSVRSIPFIRFRRERDMIAWVQRLNKIFAESEPLTRYGYEWIGDDR